MKPNIILILVMGGIILIMGASSHPTSEEPLTYGNTTASIHWEYTHHRQPRTNMITSLIAGQEMTNTNISMTTTRKNTQSITKN